MGILLASALIAPLGVLALLLVAPLRGIGLKIAPWAPLPALFVAVFLGGEAGFDLPWLFMGGAWKLDPIARVFLGFSAAVWLAAGLYAQGYLRNTDDRHPDTFFFWFLAAQFGNLALVPAQDTIGFTVFFTIMSLSAYGLIVHHQSPANLGAGRVYLTLAIIGELVAFYGIVWLGSLAGGKTSFVAAAEALAASPDVNSLMLLFLIGFGIKLGLMPLHFWLPLAHPAAPTPASAVLSGVMIKTGALFWVRVFPFGGAGAAWAVPLMLAGLGTAFLAALIGMTQTNPKALLAYSSISQMGLLLIGVAIGLRGTIERETLLIMLLAFVSHHALAKGALFLGVGLAGCRWRGKARTGFLAGLAVCGGALAGLPLTSGQAAKSLLKAGVVCADPAWQGVLELLLPLTGMTTGLLMIRYLMLIERVPVDDALRARRSMIVPWAGLTLGVLVFPWIIAGLPGVGAVAAGFSVSGMVKGVLPVLGAGAIAAMLLVSPGLRRWAAETRIPPGDLVYALFEGIRLCRRLIKVAIIRPLLIIRAIFLELLDHLRTFESTLLETASVLETFPLGILLMMILAAGMAMVL
jgi:formate hydrogenlyase subunit 3/multisubunit Na+/H+ antiporter MnhD subunit